MDNDKLVKNVRFNNIDPEVFYDKENLLHYHDPTHDVYYFKCQNNHKWNEEYSRASECCKRFKERLIQVNFERKNKCIIL